MGGAGVGAIELSSSGVLYAIKCCCYGVIPSERNGGVFDSGSIRPEFFTASDRGVVD